MPVKFRCQHCKQLLGISHKKIGQVVDCPKCGRSVRVPKEDGVAHAPPKPEFNLEDSALVRALDELAQIGQPQNSALSSPDKKGAKDFDDQDFEEQEFGEDVERPLDSANRSSVKGSWLPAPQLFPADPPLPAIKVEPPTPPAPAAAPAPAVPPASPAAGSLTISPSVDAALEAASAHHPAALASPSTAQVSPATPGPASARPVAPATPDSAANWREVAAIAPIGGHTPIHVSQHPAHSSHQRLTIAVAAVAGFLGGMLIGFPAGYLLQPTKRPEKTDIAAVAPREKPEPSVAGFAGKVSFKKSGASHPDEGARVLVLPETRSGTIKLSAVGLRLGDNVVDEQVSLAAVRALGGDLAVAGADGRFTTQLPAAGKYHVIVVSGQQGNGGEKLPDEIANVLSAYLNSPAEFVGERRVHYEIANYRGEGTDPVEVSFAALD